ncbi:MAG: CYTH domain-containing protein [Magnetococcales bacterium]|nr:CYTH domain-containing protein [Magnetococcales bacterium]
MDFRQGFLSTVKERVVRVRLAGETGTMTVKGITRGFSKTEFEYEIPKEHALVMLDDLCEKPLIEKVRYKVQQGDLTWEIDEFAGANTGLILAEVELEDEGQALDQPAWVGEEISDDTRYFNSNLVRHPFSEWPENQ